MYFAFDHHEWEKNMGIKSIKIGITLKWRIGFERCCSFKLQMVWEFKEYTGLTLVNQPKWDRMSVNVWRPHGPPGFSLHSIQTWESVEVSGPRK